MLNLINIPMPMSFNEKSAWIMFLALLVGGVIYFGLVLAASLPQQVLAPPTLPLVATYTAVLVLVAVVGHIIAAVFSPAEATATLDERERAIAHRASGLASMLLAIGILMSLAVYLLTSSGDLLFYTVFASLMVGQLAEYGMQIVLYRLAV